MTLYRKYRPQSFADFVNQKPIKLTIQNQILQNKMAHAYLFTGPRGTGKTTMARLLAKALNCETRKKHQFEPCNKCQNCQEISKGISLDLEEKDAASNRGIDEIRSLRENIRFAPSKSKYKIFIIDEVHMLTAPAFNALLKTLEEPPENTIFILATTEPHKLPETIISRCQRFDFKKIGQEEIVERLCQIVKTEEVDVEEDILANIAMRSEGCVRDGLSMLGQIITIGVNQKDRRITWEEAALVIPRSDRQLIEKLVNQLEQSDARGGIQTISHLMQEGVDLEQFTLDLINFLREKMIHETCNMKHETNEMVMFYSKLIDIFIKRYEDLKRVSFLPQLPMELGVLEACQIQLKIKHTSSAVRRRGGNEKLKIPNKEKITVKEQEAVIGEHISLEYVRQKWPIVLEQMKKYNHSVPMALSASQLLRLDGDKLVLGFKYPIHYQQVIKSQKNRDCLEGILHDVYGRKIIAEGEIAENVASAESQIDNKELVDVEEEFMVEE
ncbi:MAG: DNA polymerase III subunit gamma/tau [Candidatus Jacksonbacteria bacterium]